MCRLTIEHETAESGCRVDVNIKKWWSLSYVIPIHMSALVTYDGWLPTMRAH